MIDRRLEWRDRYVLALTQSIADDDCNSALNQPLKLSAGINEINLRVTAEEFTKLFSALMAGADLVYPYEAHQLVWLLWRAVQCPVTPTSSLYCEENEDDMACSKLPIVRIAGVPYIVEDCGCDGTNFYQLIPAAVGADGLPNPALGGGSDGWIWQGNTPVLTATDCYKQKATEYLLGRAEAFTIAVAQFAVEGYDAISAFDEVFNIGTWAASILAGTEFQDIEDLAQASIEAAFADSAFIATMTAAWDSSLTNITRSDIRAWGKNAPMFVGLMPMRSQIADSWANYLNMNVINDDLVVLRAECNSGLDVSTDPVTGYDWRYTWNFALDSNGTGTGSGGWAAAPTFGSGWDSAQGWHAGGGSQDNLVVIQNTGLGAKDILSVRLHMSGSMNGNSNLFSLQHDSPLVEFASGNFPAQNPISVSATQTIDTVLALAIEEISGGDPNAITVSIRRVDVYGTGTVPPDGTPF